MTSNDPNDGISQDNTADLTIVLGEVRDELARLRASVDGERKGRRLSQRLIWLIAAVFALFVVTTIAVERVGVVRDREAIQEQLKDRRTVDCQRDNERRVEVRSAIVAAVDEVATLAEIDADMERRLLEGVDRRVAAELPPVDC